MVKIGTKKSFSRSSMSGIEPGMFALSGLLSLHRYTTEIDSYKDEYISLLAIEFEIHRYFLVYDCSMFIILN